MGQAPPPQSNETLTEVSDPGLAAKLGHRRGVRPPTAPGPGGGLRAPTNDTCATALLVGANSITPADTTGATDGVLLPDLDPPFTCKFGTTADLAGHGTVWFKFVAVTTSASISTCTSAGFGDSLLAVYSGACGALTPLDCNDDSAVCAPGALFSHVVASPLNIGATYYICLANFDPGDFGQFSLVIESPAGSIATNDACGAAIPLTPGVLASALTAVSTTSPNDPLPPCVTPVPPGNPSTNGTVWFTFTATQPTMILTTCNSPQGDSVLTVFSGACGALTPLACSDDACGALASLPLTGLSVGQPYLVMAAQKNRAFRRASYALLLDVPVANDTCAAGTTLAVPSAGVFSTVGATADASPCGGAFPAGVWFNLVGNGRKITVSTCGAPTNINTRLAVFTGACDSLVCVESASVALPACSPGDAAAVTFCSQASVTYRVLVSDEAGALGAFQLSVIEEGLCTPGDLCSTAVPLQINAPALESNAQATSDLGAPVCGGQSGFSAGLWYSVVGNGQVLRASTCYPSGTLNSRVAVYTGSCNALVCVGANATAVPTCVPSTSATVEFCSNMGQVYFVLVAPDTPSTGSFELRVTSPGPCPANDLCAGAITLPVPSSTPGSTVGATVDAGAPTCLGAVVNPGVWYRVIGNGHWFTAGTCGAPFDTRMSVYCGAAAAPCSNLAGLVCIDGSDDNQEPPPWGCGPGAQEAKCSWCTEPGVPYLILVHGGAGATGPTGPFTLVLTEEAACSDALACGITGACCTGGACSLTVAAACTGQYLGDGTLCFPPGGAPITFTTSPGLAIPDATCGISGYLSSVLTVPASFTIADLNLTVNIPGHTYVGDLDLRLTKGTASVRVWPRWCASADGLAATFDDEGAAVSCTSPVTGQVRPFEPLSLFDGSDASGDWTLQFCDAAGADTGTLVSWSLVLTPAAPGPCADGPDCFTRGSAGPTGAGCAAPFATRTRPTNNGHFIVGGPDGDADTIQCRADWDGDGCILPADVAAFVLSAFYSFSNPGNLDADIDCDQQAVPSDVAQFVTNWFEALTNPASQGCQ